MNTRETNEIRELTAAELEEVDGGMSIIKSAVTAAWMFAVAFANADPNIEMDE